MAAMPSNKWLDILADAVEAFLEDDPLVGLFTNTPDLSPELLLAGLTEPTFTGYARVPAVVGARRSNANGDIIIPLGTFTFQPTAGTALPQTVTGVFVAAGDPSALLLQTEMLTTPWQVTSVLSAIDIIVELYIRADQTYGIICTICTP